MSPGAGTECGQKLRTDHKEEPVVPRLFDQLLESALLGNERVLRLVHSPVQVVDQSALPTFRTDPARAVNAVSGDAGRGCAGTALAA